MTLRQCLGPPWTEENVIRALFQCKEQSGGNRLNTIETDTETSSGNMKITDHIKKRMGRPYFRLRLFRP